MTKTNGTAHAGAAAKGTETAMEKLEIEAARFARTVAECADPAELGRKVRLAFKRMPGETALICFANAMTADLPHPIKVAVWDAVRHSHIWWGELRLRDG